MQNILHAFAFLSNLFLHHLNPIIVFDFQIKTFPPSYLLHLLLEELVIGLGIEVQSSDVGNHFLEFIRKSKAKSIDLYGELFLHYFIIFLFLALTFHGLPRQAAAQEVNENIDQGL